MPTIRVINVGLSGLGPRGCLFIANLAAYLGFHQKVKQLPPFAIHIAAFDKQDRDNIGCGNAFQKNCDAAANTPLTAGSLDYFNNIPDALKGFLDLQSSAASDIDISDYLSFTNSRNPTAAALLRQGSCPDGTIDWSRAFLTRGEWGRLQSSQFQRVLDVIETKLPRLRISINPLCEVVGTDFTDPTHPALLVREVGADKITSHGFDQVVLANGLPTHIPVSSEVAPRAYSGTPCHDDLRDHLLRQGVLIKANRPERCEDNQPLIFKPGTRIGIAGQSLSAFDFIPLMILYLPGIQSSALSDYAISDSVAEDYKSLFTFVSRTPRSPIPKHNNGWTWYGTVSIFSTEEMHALRLQSNYNWMAIAEEFLHANVAYCVGKVPAEINSLATSTELMGFFYRQNQTYIAATTDEGRFGTEVGLLMAGELAILYGAGFEVDPKAAEDKLAAKAPLTRAGRFRWPIFRSSTMEMSSPSNAYTDEAKSLVKRWSEVDFSAIGSPLAIQHWIALLFERGIATHMIGSFEDFHCSTVDCKIQLGDKTFDALVAPKQISRGADRVLGSLGSVATLVPGQPKYGKGRHYTHKNGQGIQAFDFGLGGEGSTSKETMVGKQWTDTHSHSSASQSMACFALQTIIHCAALAANRPPIPTVSRLYKRVLPTDVDFAKETAQFETVWQEAQLKAVFLRRIKELAGNDRAKYQTYFSHVADRVKREEFIDSLHPSVVRSYRRECRHILPFKPVTRDEYEARFIDFTQCQLEKMLGQFVNSTNAKSTLASTRSRQS